MTPDPTRGRSRGRTCTECGGAVKLLGEQSQGPDRTRRVYRCADCGAYGTEDYDRGRIEYSGCLAGERRDPPRRAPDGGR